MGVIFFIGLLFFLSCIGFFMILVNLIFIINWRSKKKRGRQPKKRYLVIPSVFLTAGLIIWLIPAALFCYLRFVSTAKAPEFVPAPSGKMVYWATNRYGGSDTGSFNMDGVLYIEIGLPESIAERGEPVANITHDPETQSFLDDLFHFLLAGKNANVGTLYPVKNAGGFTVYTTGYATFCRASEADEIRAYFYRDALEAA